MLRQLSRARKRAPAGLTRCKKRGFTLSQGGQFLVMVTHLKKQIRTRRHPQLVEAEITKPNGIAVPAQSGEECESPQRAPREAVG